MPEQNSLLDKIIKAQQAEEANQFDPAELVTTLLKNLSQKERDILIRRFGLFGQKKETLEQVGKFLNITRERVRQIQKTAINKLKKLPDFSIQIRPAESNFIHLLEEHGGMMEENDFFKELLGQVPDDKTSPDKQEVFFIINQILEDKIEKIKSDLNFYSGWKLKSVSLDLLKETLEEVINIFKKVNHSLKIKDLLESFKEGEFFKDTQDRFSILSLGKEKFLEKELKKIIKSYLKISKKTGKNILGEWGLTSWSNISPKRMADKIYLVFQKVKKPLHFAEITRLINQEKFDKKTAYPATIHNELILDDRFVLIGRGIYALREWGYQPGTVSDIIVWILKKSPNPLTKEEITKEVLKQRIVKRSTIYLALTDKDKFKKLDDGKYTLNKEILSPKSQTPHPQPLSPPAGGERVAEGRVRGKSLKFEKLEH